jgi:hypothetical protein
MRIVRERFIPLFHKYSLLDPKFGVAILPMVFMLESRFSDEEFLDLFIKPLKPLLGHVEIPKLLECFLDNINVLLKRIPSELRVEYLYPAMDAALLSNDRRLLDQVLAVIPYMLESMDVTTVQASLVPT